MTTALDAPNALANPPTDALPGAARQRLTRLGHLATRAAWVTQARTDDATTAMQGLSDTSLRELAASSVGLGVGLYLARQPRIVVLAGIVPAILAALAIRRRPARPSVRPLAVGADGPVRRDVPRPVDETA